MITEVDEDKDGAISYKEFKKAMHSKSVYQEAMINASLRQGLDSPKTTQTDVPAAEQPPLVEES